MLPIDENWSRVSLYFCGDGLPFEEIETKLGINPSDAGRKGETVGRIGGKRLSDVWSWLYPVNSDVDFETQVSGILDVLEPKKEALKEILALPNIEGYLLLAFSFKWGQGGGLFSNQLLKRITDCGLSLCLDVYPSFDEE